MKKLLAALLTLVMLVSAVPVSAQTDGGASAASAPATASQPAVKKVTFPEPERYGRTVLAQYPNSAALLDAYDCFEKAMKNPSPSYIYLATPLTDSEGELVCELFQNDHALSKEYGFTRLHENGKFVAVAAHLNETCAERVAATEAAVDKIITKVNPAWSDYDKALYLHDYVVGHVDYQMVGAHQSAYGALVDGVAVCAGYARAYQALLNAVGIPAFYITGYAGGPHAWNYVKLDGNWYKTDVTFDDTISELLSHHCFNMTDVQDDGRITYNRYDYKYENNVAVSWSTYPLPVCDSMELATYKYHVYKVEKLNAKTWKKVYQIVREKGKQGYDAVKVTIAKNNPDNHTDESLAAWLEENIKKEKMSDCLLIGSFGWGSVDFHANISIKHTYSSGTDTTCNTCGEKRQVKCHVWKKGTCALCGLTMPSSITVYQTPDNIQVKDGERFNLWAKADGVDLNYRWYVKYAGKDKYDLEDQGKWWAYNREMSIARRDCSVYCVITDKYGHQVKTKAVVLRMAASIISEPATAVYAPLGKEASVKIKAAGDGLKYQWYLKSAGAKNFAKSSITSATYSATMREAVKGRQIYCEITDKYGNKVKTKTFTLREGVAITTQPATVAYASLGEKATVKITASGEGLKYQWYLKNAGAKNFAKSSITSATYSTTMGEKAKNRQVYCEITDKYGNKVKTKTFTLRESVSITTQPKTVTVKKNATAKVTLKASGDGLTYQWYIKNATATKFSKSSVTTATYSTKMTDKVKNRQIYCVIKDKYGNTVKTVTVKLNMQ